jgi:uncharacterized protein YkwD
MHAAGLLVALLCALLLPAGAASSDDLGSLRRHALELVNQVRVQEGLPPLELGGKANAAAQAHAEDMLALGYYAHTSPSGATARDRYSRAGGAAWRLTAENIARCTGCPPPPMTASVASLHEGWMNSPPHRQNILRRGLSEFGFGIAVAADRGLYAVQVFAGPGTPSDLQPGEPAAALTADALRRSALDHVNRLRREADRAPLELSPALSTAAGALLPDPVGEHFDLGARQSLLAALPEAERPRWRSLSALGAACGGCGSVPMEADIRSFVKQWLGDGRHRATLLGAGVTHFGFALAANGDGRKVALGLLGAQP